MDWQIQGGVVKVEDAQVYLTNSSMGALRQLYFESIRQVDEHVRKAVYREDLAWILSTIELKSLYAELLVASGIEQFRISGTKAQRSDGRHLFRSNGPLKYHFDSSKMPLSISRSSLRGRPIFCSGETKSTISSQAASGSS